MVAEREAQVESTDTQRFAADQVVMLLKAPFIVLRPKALLEYRLH